MRVVELQKNAACQNHDIFFLWCISHNFFKWIYIERKLSPSDSWYTSCYSDCSMKMEKKSWIYVDISSEVSVCLIVLCILEKYNPFNNEMGCYISPLTYVTMNMTNSRNSEPSKRWVWSGYSYNLNIFIGFTILKITILASSFIHEKSLVTMISFTWD